MIYLVKDITKLKDLFEKEIVYLNGILTYNWDSLHLVLLNAFCYSNKEIGLRF